MQIILTGDVETLHLGLTLMAERAGVHLREESSSDAIRLTMIQRKGPIEAVWDGEQGVIGYDQRCHGFRGFGLWIERLRAASTVGGGAPAFHIRETPQFTTVGAMLDASRNAIPSLSALRDAFITFAFMGFNQLMLYTEDTYEVEAYPYFGYMRGRYTQDELRQIDDWADMLGIEVIPCIQTLAHLVEALKWEYAADMKDNEDILLIGEEKTYAFIERMIEAASAPFRSRRIHIGMDEAHQLGLGTYLKRNGYRNRFELMNEHLQRVVEITRRCGLAPMIWSDMYFRLGSATGGYYDLEANIPHEAVEGMPQDISLVYWDYYHNEQQFYETFIRKHLELGRPVVFAGGVWTWNGLAPNTGKTRATTEPALMACKALGIQEVVATMWGDNGAETPWISAWQGLQLYAEHAYAEKVDEQRLKERFAFCVGGRYEDFDALGQFDETPGVGKGNPDTSNPSKFLLWQDLLIGLFDANVKGLPLREHYHRLADHMKGAADANEAYRSMFGWYQKLAEVLALKCDLGLRLKEAYDQCRLGREEQHDVKQEAAELRLAGVLEEIAFLGPEVEELRRKHRQMWLEACKPFGWEVMDMRYGALSARLQTACERVRQYLDGTVSSLPELEEERLTYNVEFGYQRGATLGRAPYHRIVSASSLFKPV